MSPTSNHFQRPSYIIGDISFWSEVFQVLCGVHANTDKAIPASRTCWPQKQSHTGAAAVSDAQYCQPCSQRHSNIVVHYIFVTSVVHTLGCSTACCVLSIHRSTHTSHRLKLFNGKCHAIDRLTNCSATLWRTFYTFFLCKRVNNSNTAEFSKNVLVPHFAGPMSNTKSLTILMKWKKTSQPLGLVTPLNVIELHHCHCGVMQFLCFRHRWKTSPHALCILHSGLCV